MSSDGRSAVLPERWFPVYDALMHGRGPAHGGGIAGVPPRCAQRAVHAPEDSPDVEPVYLLPGGPLRFALLAYLSVAHGLARGTGVTASVAV